MFTLVRYTRTETAVLGSLYLNGAFVCYTLENAVKLIPCGLYTVQNSKSPKFKRELPLIWNAEVPAKRGVRVHRGNSYRDSRACVLVGMGRDVKNCLITESANAEIMVTMLCRNESKLVIVDDSKHGMTDK